MALFDFDVLEVQVKSSAGSPGDERHRATASSAAPASAAVLAAGAQRVAEIARSAAVAGAAAGGGGRAAPTAAPGRHAEPRRQKQPDPPLEPGGFFVLLKRYESADVEKVAARRDQTVKALQDLMVLEHGFEDTVKLVGGRSGARDRYQQKQKGWALEGHVNLDSSQMLGSLTCSALLVYQRRAGPVAELDLAEMARRLEEERQAREAREAAKRREEEERWTRLAHEAAVRAEVEAARAEAQRSEDEARAQAEALAAFQAAEEAAALAAAGGGGEEAERLAEALQVELEVEQRLKQVEDCPGKGVLGATLQVFPPKKGNAGSAWNQPEPDPLFFADALNELLSQTKRVIETSARYSTKVLEEVARYFATLCLLLNALVLCSFPRDVAAKQFQGVYSAFTKPQTGIFDLICAWCDAATLFKGRNPHRFQSWSPEAQRLNSQNSDQTVANCRRELLVTLRVLHRCLAALLETAEAGARRAEAAACFSNLEDLLRKRLPPSAQAQLGPMRLVRTTPAIMTKLLCDLRAGFKESAFQDEYRDLPRGDARVLMALTVQRVVLPRHGFSGDFKGVRNMRQEVSQHTAVGDGVVWKLMKDIHQLLDVADTWHEEVFTLDFGNASRVEQEVSLLYQQDFTLTNLEKLVGARLTAACARGTACGLQGSASIRAGIELFFARLCAPKVRQPLPMQAFAALATTAREVYAAMGGPRRRLALNMVQEAVGCKATRRAIAAAEMLRLGEEPLVASKRHALETLNSQVLQCFQNQPEVSSYVNASVLASRWQRGELGLEDTEHGGETALHLAAGDGNLELVGALLLLGAQVDRRDRLGRTPAHWAAACGHAAVLAALADRGADLGAADAHGRTPKGFMGSGSAERRPAPARPRWCD